MLSIEFSAQSQTPDGTLSSGLITSAHLSQQFHYIKPDNRIVRQDAALMMNSFSNLHRAGYDKRKMSFNFDNMPVMRVRVFLRTAFVGDHRGNAEISPCIQDQQYRHH